MEMTELEKQAYNWALKQQYQSVAASYARILAKYIQRQDERPLALYDLVMKCRDRSYQFFGDNEKYLQDLKLVEASGDIHGSIKNIVLSAVRGDGIDMVLSSPVVKST